MLFTKLVKGLAMALAVVLSVTIIGGMFYGGAELLHAVGIIKDNPAEMRVAYEEAKNESTENATSEAKTEVKNLEIKLGAGSLELKKGEKLKVTTDMSEMTVEEKDGTLSVKEESKWHLFSWRRGRNVTIEIPKDYKFKNVKIDTGAGRILIEQILATNELKMNLGAGEVSIKEADANKIDIDCGVGKVGIGLADVDTTYHYSVEKGVGKITVDGREGEGKWGSLGATKSVKINGGVGEIEVKTGVGTGDATGALEASEASEASEEKK